MQRLTMMFENPEYQETLDKINKVRSLGLSAILKIPQIAIVGDQSSGKSSVLEAITKLTFPRDKDTCTSFATQVNMRRNEKVEMLARIEGQTDFNKKYHAQEAQWDIHTIINDAKEILCSQVAISEKVLEITLSGPTLSPLTIIDLPGYISTTVDGQDKSIVGTIRDINTRYIKDSRTIILAVVPANVDLNNSTALGQAELYDHNNERTIPIVTKPDTVEPDLLPNLVETLLNRKKHMKLGYLVMRNSRHGEMKNTWDEAKRQEEDFFRSSNLWDRVSNERKGRESVNKFLGDILYKHIKGELPSLKEEIKRMIDGSQMEISSLGPQMTSMDDAKRQYSNCVQALQRSLDAFLAGDYSLDYLAKFKTSFTSISSSRSPESISYMAYTTESGNRDTSSHTSNDDFPPPPSTENKPFVRATLDSMYSRYSQDMNRGKHIVPKNKINELLVRYRGTGLPGILTSNTFTQIYRETLVHLRDTTNDHVRKMHSELFDAVINFIDFAADPLLTDLLQLEFEKFYHLQVAKIEDNVKSMFEDESKPFTMSTRYEDNVLKGKKTILEQQYQEQLQKPGNSPNPKDKDPQKSLNIDYDRKLAEKLAADELYETLLSYCEVSRTRIVDVVILQNIERYMVNQISIYYRMLNAVEDSHIACRLLDSQKKLARRHQLHEKIETLRKSLLEL
ncbi:hypothetical protein BGX27_010099 [Mortierella sp. AM989]|nr:hypothetical protein BGX27_010099 [Mortierella sp. AM989]